MPTGKSFDERVKQRLQEVGLSVPEAARKAKIPYNTFRAWMREGRLPPSAVPIFAEILRTPFEDREEWGYKVALEKKRSFRAADQKFTGEELELLVAVHKVLGDLSLDTILHIVRDHREKKQEA